MPISTPKGYDENHFSRVYEHLIKPACEEVGLNTIIANEVQKTNYIIIDILRRIIESDLVICDLSSKNPNVLYEIGIRQAFNLPSVLIKDKQTDRMFDIQGLRTLEYNESLRVDSVVRDRKNLIESIKETIMNNKNDVNSLIQLLGMPKAEYIKNNIEISKETRLLLDSIKDVSARLTSLEEAQKSVFTKTSNKIDCMYDHLRHIFFARIKYYLDNECWWLGSIDNNCIDDAKKNIVNNMLRAKLSFWYCGYINLFCYDEVFDREIVRTVIKKIVVGYKEKWKKLEIPTYVSNIFNEKHDSRAEYIFSRMDELFQEQTKGGISDEIIKKEFLDCSLSVLDNTISDINFVIRDINLDNNDKNYKKEYTNCIKNKNKVDLKKICLDLL